MRIPAGYRLLLKAYPRSFRERWGGELVAFWRRQAAERRYRGAAGRIRLALQRAGDVFRGIRQRLRPTATPTRREPPRDPAPRRWLAELGQAFRALRRSPSFALVATVTLSLGIGATTAVVAVVDQVLLRPLDYPAAERLFLLSRSADAGDEVASVAWLDFVDWRDGARGFEGMAAWTETSAVFQGEEGAIRRQGARVTRNLFEVLGVSPLLGRTFTAGEDRPGGPGAVILSWGVWQDQLGSAPDAVGGTVLIDGEAVPVVGVMPRGFAYPDARTRFWSPLREEEVLAEAGLPAGTRTLAFLDVVARVAPGVEPAVARADLRALAARVDDDNLPAERPRRSVDMIGLLDQLVGDVRGTLFVLLAAAALVLVVACANVAGLAVSRSVTRERELTVRAALGAGRGTLLGQLLAEGAALVVVGGAAGLAIARALLGAIVALAPTDLPRIDTLTIDGRVLLGWAAITILSALLFALVPALRGSRVTTATITRGRGGSAGRRELRPQRTLVVFQVSLSVVLLAGALLLTRSYAALRAVDPGFATTGILTASIDPPERTYGNAPERTEAFWSELLDRVRAMPGVGAATSTYSAPLTGQEFRTTVVAEGAEDAEPLWAGTVAIRDHFFETTGVRLLAGREFDSRDTHGAPGVAIVGEALARRLWPGEDPIGRRLRMAGGVSGALYAWDRDYFAGWLTVIGVASDVRRASLDAEPVPELYRPHGQLPWPLHTIIIRASQDPADLAGPLRRAVRDIDPAVPVESVRTVRTQVREALAAPRFRMLLLSGFAAVTCLLAMVGLHAVLALAVARRTRELGIRMALGATRLSLVRHTLARGLALVAAGTVFGVSVAIVATRALTSLLFGVTPADLASWAGVVGLTMTVALLACALPARRAGRVDPIRSIQAE